MTCVNLAQRGCERFLLLDARHELLGRGELAEVVRRAQRRAHGLRRSDGRHESGLGARRDRLVEHRKQLLLLRQPTHHSHIDDTSPSVHLFFKNISVFQGDRFSRFFLGVYFNDYESRNKPTAGAVGWPP